MSTSKTGKHVDETRIMPFLPVDFLPVEYASFLSLTINLLSFSLFLINITTTHASMVPYSDEIQLLRKSPIVLFYIHHTICVTEYDNGQETRNKELTSNTKHDFDDDDGDQSNQHVIHPNQP